MSSNGELDMKELQKPRRIKACCFYSTTIHTPTKKQLRICVEDDDIGKTLTKKKHPKYCVNPSIRPIDGQDMILPL